ncbi:unnamed protein product [Adineta ricciae]|uniref:PARP catalytic domain-containing protein n=1 Tax=Adineta ricciae TaxID=249248 RepID=A0A814NKD6_ADIRI|nr:unnamed protein product [Adineta ricciae]CAF1222298.1 unnamed protein product [Adineta ricciae]
MCCNCPRFYKYRILLLAVLSLCEALCGSFRVFIMISPAISKNEAFAIENVANLTDHIAIAFLLDWISSIMAFLMGIMVLLFIAMIQCMCCFACVYAIVRTGSKANRKGCCESLGAFKALHRFISFDCNCPCYRARPKLRFRLRAIFLSLCILLRGMAIYLYWSVSKSDRRGQSNFYTCSVSMIFLAGTLLLDLYHYGVWWCYTPSIDTRCHCRSRKHKRYLPYHIVGKENRKDMIGDRECAVRDCRNRHLSHVAIFHSESYHPQPRWSRLKAEDPAATYIGFHVTKASSAVSIVHSEFHRSSQGMLGKGVYFARSTAGARAKAEAGKSGGAFIIAVVKMGKVFEVDKRQIYRTKTSRTFDKTLHDFVFESKWHAKYDTCYMNHDDESKDEFCIKDPESQILKWVVVIEKEYDTKVKEYGLDTEFDSTVCYCV